MIQDNHHSPVSSDDLIAVVGMAGRFPGAANVAQFWRNLRDGVESVRPFTTEELRAAGVDAEQLDDPDYVNRGAPLDDADCFDAAFFGYRPREAELMDPQHRLFLQCAYAAIQDAGYDPENCPLTVGVFGGVARNTYFMRYARVYLDLIQQGAMYDVLLSSEKDFPATRVSYKLNLNGPSINVQSACSSSGVAIHLACQSLLSGECDMALAGGARVRVPMNAGYLYMDGGIPSPDGHCRAFDAEAGGCVYGSGVGMVVLKRTADAIRDGDHIECLILGSAVNNDGSRKIGFTAPSVEGQASVIAEALAVADVDASAISYVEAHGTGTTLGDPIEIAALTKAFCESTDQRGYCAIGTLKTNIGHLDAGAGVAGLIKTALALKHQQIPASLNYTQPNPQIDFERSPFYVNDRLQDWNTNGKPRRAGLSSFGLGGTNFHAVLQEAPDAAPSSSSRSHHLLTLSAKTADALATATSELAEHLRNNPSSNLADVAYTLQTGRASMMHRRSWLCTDVDDAIAKLDSTVSEQPKPTPNAPATIAFMFPGQGSQYVGMGQDLYEQEQLFKEEVDSCCRRLEPSIGLDLRHLLYPHPSEKERATELLKQTRYTQPALFVVEYALARLWQSWGIQPQALIGHSIGEYVAAVVAGVFSLGDALKIVAVRGRLMQDQAAGNMLVVPFSEEQSQRLLSGGLALAASNAPELSVITGPSEEIDAISKQLADQGVDARVLHTSHAFHSAMMDPVVDQLLAELRQVRFNAPIIPWISGVTGTWITDAEAQDSSYWAKQLREPVLFSQGIMELQRDANRILLEVGPGKTLYTLAKQHPVASGCSSTIVASLRHVRQTQHDLECMLGALGELWTAGTETDWSKLFKDQHRLRVSLPTYPFERTRHWLNDEPAVNQQQIPTMNDQPTDSSPAPTTAPVTTSPVTTVLAFDRKTAVYEELKSILCELSGVDSAEIDSTSTFLEMGFDSLFLTRANVAFQRKFKVKITFRQLFEEAPTLDALAAYIDKKLPADAFTPPLPPPSPSPSPASDVPAAGQTASTAVDQLPAADVPTLSTSAPLTSAVPLTPAGSATNQSLVQQVMQQQFDLMRQQLDVLRQTGDVTAEGQLAQQPQPVQQQTTDPTPAAVATVSRGIDPDRLPDAPNDSEKKFGGFGPFRPLKKGPSTELTAQQRTLLGELIEKYNRKTRGSKQHAQQYRQHFADARTVAGFRQQWKELVYPIVAERSAGSRIWDIDGNEYVDVVMGFGAHLFGHSPPFITEAIQQQLQLGMELGPQTPLAGQVAELFCELTDSDRMMYSLSGSESILGALRAARTVTGRDRIAVFSGGYHGRIDCVIVRPTVINGKRHSFPQIPGIPQHMVEDTIVLDYGDFDSLDVIRKFGDELAAVMVEPVQSRNPNLQPGEFLRALREVTTECDVALIFDEVITGLRSHPGGAQAYFGVKADIATYGKTVGGGMPLSILAGRSEFMDVYDGGNWRFGDDSFPESSVTFLGGTYIRHPLAVAASHATLLHLKQQGPKLQQQLSGKTSRFAAELNHVFEQQGVPAQIDHFSSLFMFRCHEEFEYSGIFFPLLRQNGIHIYEDYPCFLSTAHSDADIAFMVDAVKESIDEMQRGGFLPDSRGATVSPVTKLTATVPAFDKSESTLVAKTPVANNGHGTTESPPGSRKRAPTEAQKEIWIASQLGDDASSSFNLGFRFDFRGALQPESLRAAIQRIIQRHDALRLSFGRDGSAISFAEQMELEIPLIDLSALDQQTQRARVEEIAEAETAIPFDLVDRPLLRAQIVKCSESTWHLLLTFHHLVCDGYSTGTVIKDLEIAYAAISQGSDPELSDAMQYSEYASWQYSQKSTPESVAAEQYYLERFATPPPFLEMPCDHQRPAIKTYGCGEIKRAFDSSLADEVKSFSVRAGVSLFSTLIAAASVLLHRLAGQDDVVLGVPVAGQSMVGRDDLVGHCVNMHPVRCLISGDMKFSDYLKASQSRVLDMFDHGNFTVGPLFEKADLPRDASRNSLFSVQFNVENVAPMTRFGDLDVDVTPCKRSFHVHELAFNVLSSGKDLEFLLAFNSDLYDASSAERWLAYYETLLQSIVSDPDQAISDLRLIPNNELKTVLEDWNDTTVDRDSSCIQQLVESTAADHPDRIAIEDSATRLTYRDLNEKANRLAFRLIEQGAKPESLIGVHLNRSANMVVGVLAILKAGAAYVPLDPSFPPQRLDYMIEDSGLSLLLTERELLGNLQVPNGIEISIDAQPETDVSRFANNPNVELQSTALAYVIYTSGSTGNPKGVQISHRAFVNFIKSMQREPGMSWDDRLLAVTTLSFDIAGLEIFLPLACGGTVQIVGSETAADALQLSKVVDNSGATVMQATPATWRMLIEAGWKGSSNLRVLCGGEALPRDLIDPLLERCGDLWNMYGPTETTVWSSVQQITSSDDVISIGRPIANTEMYILDEQLNAVPIGVAGRLFIGGDGLARGYLDRPELTVEKFIPHPLRPNSGDRIYDTGDLARYLSDGRIECLGRTDHQVKIRGYRIELGEIEARLADADGLHQAAVTVHEPTPGDQRLVAYYTTSSGTTELNHDDLLAHLRRDLPDYMVPRLFVPLETMPLTPNRKVDRKALPTPEQVRHKSPDAQRLIDNLKTTLSGLQRRTVELERSSDAIRLSDSPGLNDALNDLCRAHVCRYLVAADPEFRHGAIRDIEAQRTALGLLPAFTKFHQCMLEMLEQDGVIEQRDGQVTVLQDPVGLSDTAAQEQFVRAASSGFEGTLTMLDHCCRQYCEVLSGEIPGASVLFVDGQRDFLERCLRQETVAHRNLGTYRELARKLIVDVARTRPVRILEVGGGGGQMTWELATALKDLEVHYTFTDVGPSIVDDARREAKNRGLDFIDFAVLDITQDLAEQDSGERRIEPKSFDIVLGLNVVHATPDLDETLGQLAKLLAPGGFLALIEYVKPLRWDDLIWGVTQGWWCYNDQYRSRSALVDVDTWETAFRESGFCNVQGLPIGQSRESTDAALIFGTAPGSITENMSSQSPSQRKGRPRDAVELQLCQIWESLLRFKPIGIDDDFFDLGGHSLLAVQFVLEVEKTYGQRLPFATLLQHRNVAELAEIIRSEDWTPHWKCLVPIRPGGSRTPLFLIHAAGGNVLVYDDLARHLGEDQPVYGLQSQGLNGQQPLHSTVEEMAAAYRQEIQELQPRGPYMLGGYCMGGTVALEIARQLYEQDEEVALVALLDCHNWANMAPIPRLGRWYHQWQKLDFHWRNLWRLPTNEKRRFMSGKFRELGRRKNVWYDATTPTNPRSHVETQFNGSLAAIWKNNEEVAARYVPSSYPGRITQFCPMKNYYTVRNDRAGWEDIAQGGVDVRTLQVYPAGMLMEPYVKQLAAELSECIGQAFGRVIETNASAMSLSCSSGKSWQRNTDVDPLRV